MTLEETALSYAQQGWPVFPLGPRGKKPIGRLVPHGLKDATTDEATIRGWWQAEPEANIGIPTGVAFDVADYDTDEAMKRFIAVCGEHGLDARKLPRVATGRGGRHVLWAISGLGNRAGVIPGMDWRGRGGYIVAPGSIHPNGSTYEWIKSPNGSGFPEPPDWLLELLDPKQPERFAESPNGTWIPPREEYIKAAVEGEIGALRASREGKRNDTLNRAAFALGQMVGAGWVQRGYAEAELLAAGLAVGLERTETVRTIRSGLEAGEKEPRRSPETQATGRIIHGGRAEVVLATEDPQDTWPAPPGSAAFYGLPGRVVELVDPFTEGDPVAVLAQFLATFGVAIGEPDVMSPHPYFPIGAVKHSPRIFVGIIGRSALARKGDSWAPVEYLMTRADESLRDRILGGFGSGEALVYAVRDPIKKEVEKDGKRFMKTIDEGVEDKRLLVMETELARLLVAVGRENSTVSQYIRDAFDGRPLRNLVKGNPAQAPIHHIGVIGHSTSEELRGRLTEDQVRNGFGNRFIWLAVQRSKTLSRPSPFKGDAVAKMIRLISDRLAVARQIEEMNFAPSAEAVWDQMYDELGYERHGWIGVLTDRSQPIVLRLAMIYALTDGATSILPEHLQAARALWDYSARSVQFIFGRTTGNVLADRILEALEEGPLTTSEISVVVFNKNIAALQLHTALAVLEARGLVVKQKVRTTEGRGRSAVRWSLR
jgi:Bifunctional DNA primase/polymerase, N-terminal/Protein of unknown function (DUF3987)